MARHRADAQLPLQTDPVEAALLAAVLAAPRDDGPRLVYADRLLERGDPRGEFIAVQCARTRCERAGDRTSDVYRDALRRERALGVENVKQWVKPFGLRRWWGEFSRGFIAQLTITPAGLRSKWPLFTRLPLERLVLRPGVHGPVVHGDLAWLADRPDAPGSLETLSIVGPRGRVLDVDARAALAAIRTVPRSHEEPVWPEGLTLPGGVFDRLAIRGLSIRMGADARVDDLLRAPGFADIRTLSIELDNDDAIALFSRAALGELTTLRLGPPGWYGLLNEAVSRALAASRGVRSLHTLACAVEDTPELRGALADAAGLDDLFVMRMSGRDLGVLADAGLPRRLHTLRARIQDVAAARAIASAPWRKLAVLDLAYSPIGDDGAREIASGRSLSTLSDLFLGACGIGDDGARALLSSESLRRLVMLSLSGNVISADTGRALRAGWPEAVVLSA